MPQITNNPKAFYTAEEIANLITCDLQSQYPLCDVDVKPRIQTVTTGIGPMERDEKVFQGIDVTIHIPN